MGLGKTVRLNRLSRHASGRFCSIAVDHFIGYQDGLPTGLRTLRDAITAGGPKADRLETALALAAVVVGCGAREMTVGRNVWGFGDTTAAVRMFKAVIHDGASAAEAMRQGQRRDPTL